MTIFSEVSSKTRIAPEIDPHPVKRPSGRSLISIFLVWHLVSLAVAVVPDPSELRVAAGTRQSPPDALSAFLAPALDQSAPVLQSAETWAWQVTTIPRRFTSRYVERLGLVQNWNMFASPPLAAEYLRMRYYSTSASATSQGPFTVATELVFPMDPGAQAQTLRAFWEAHRDKAVSNAFKAYFVERMRRSATDLGPSFVTDPALDAAVSRSFVPVVEFFSDGYKRKELPAGARLVRTEAWYGWAPSRLRDDPPLLPRSREAAIARYYRGVVEHLQGPPRFRPIDTIEREADIQWTLLFVQTP